MHEQIKAQWVAALRSGEYKQGGGALHTYRESFDGKVGVNKYCCLGILCSLAYKAGIVERYDKGSGHYSYGQDGFDYTVILPPDVADWAGLTRNGFPDCNPQADGIELSAHNDGYPSRYNEKKDERVGPSAPKSFDQIADLIDEYL